MKKILLLVACLLCCVQLFSQSSQIKTDSASKLIYVQEGISYLGDEYIDWRTEPKYALNLPADSLILPYTLNKIEFMMQLYEAQSYYFAERPNHPRDILKQDRGGVNTLIIADSPINNPLDSLDVTLCGWGRWQSNGVKFGYFRGENLYIGRSIGSTALGLGAYRKFYYLIPIKYPFGGLFSKFAAFEYEHIEIGKQVKFINAHICSKNLKTIKANCKVPPLLKPIYPDNKKEILDWIEYEYSYINWTDTTKFFPDWRYNSTMYDGYNSYTDFETPILYVPKGCVDAYRNAPIWSRFKNIIEWEDASVDLPQGHNVVIRAVNGIISIENIDDTLDVEIYNLNGSLCSRAHGPCAFTLSPGIYLVKVGNATRKVKL